MIKSNEVFGDQPQEVLLMLMANVFEKYCIKENLDDDVIDIIKNARKSLMHVLEIPLKNVSKLSSEERKNIVVKAIVELINYYEIPQYQDTIIEECLKLYSKWKKEYKKE